MATRGVVVVGSTSQQNLVLCQDLFTGVQWIRLHAPKGSIVLNTGDYMQRITNDILPSTTHRVSKPSCAALSRKGRVSMPMAIYLWFAFFYYL